MNNKTEDFLKTHFGKVVVDKLKSLPITKDISIIKDFKNYPERSVEDLAEYLVDGYGANRNSLSSLNAWLNVFHSEIIYGTRGI